tara:strand:+ start:367 stop:978 length:612 start_codon:yes stop_codon:yes gene_type:complete
MDRLNTGVFATCNSYYDEKTKKYVILDGTKKYDCCLKACDKPINFCIDYCNTNYPDPNSAKNQECEQDCGIHEDMCRDYCTLVSPKYLGMDNYYYQCTYDYGCGDKGLSNYINEDCVEENAEKILDCCKKSCQSTQEMDCESYCKYMQDVHSKYTKIVQPHDWSESAMLNPPINDNYIWIISGIVGGILLGLAVVIIFRYFKN